MRYFPVILLFHYSFAFFGQDGHIKHSNRIDRVANADQVESLVRHVIKDSGFRVVESKELAKFWFNPGREDQCAKLSKIVNGKAWEKGDFDNNGYTDLMVTGLYHTEPVVLCVMDAGDNNFSFKCITNRVFAECGYPVVKEIDERLAILYYSFKEESIRHVPPDSARIEIDTLVFNSGDFVEYNAHPQQCKIHKIQFETTPCFGSCPVFELTIDDGLGGYLHLSEYNDIHGNNLNDGGNYVADIDRKSWQLITSLLNYIDFSKLKNKYAVNWTDDQSCTLTIVYNNGQKKTIEDYGLIGTHGLARVYRLLFDLRGNQDWEKK